MDISGEGDDQHLEKLLEDQPLIKEWQREDPATQERQCPALERRFGRSLSIAR
jgi:hypothetical protein